MADVLPTRLVTFGSDTRDERLGSLHVRVIGGTWHVRGQRSNPVAPGLVREVLGASVIHCHQQHVVASSLAAITARLSGRRVFCTDLGGGGWDLSTFVSTDRLYHGHLHISEYSRQIAGHDTVSRAHLIWGGVDAVKFSPASSPLLGGPVLFVGRVLPHKGVDVLLRALPSDMAAQIIGPTTDRRYLADLGRLAEGKSVAFRHDCDDVAVVEAYRRASCIVLPSVYHDMYGGHTKVPELLGQALLEGMACGLPAICTSVASLPEIVEHGVTGLVVPPNDPDALGTAVAWVREHPVAARTMGEQARAHVLARFTWPAVVRRCLDFYGLSSARELPTATLEQLRI
jgi:glycosyltransferase involved in cell wall biosynthesis